MSLVSEEFASDGQSGEEDAPLIKRSKNIEDTEMDITPMIDITFLLLIFFLVASVPDPQVAIELPAAAMGDKVDPQLSSFITIAVNPANAEDAAVYLSDGKMEDHRVLKSAQRDEIARMLTDAVVQNKPYVIIKAEKDVQNGEVNRIMDYISEVEGVFPYLAVFEED